MPCHDGGAQICTSSWLARCVRITCRFRRTCPFPFAVLAHMGTKKGHAKCKQHMDAENKVHRTSAAGERNRPSEGGLVGQQAGNHHCIKFSAEYE